ncbi:hypothetical protein RB598_005148 [Gaeumannomyces tritici]
MAGSVAAQGSPSASSDSLDQVECNIIERKPGEPSKKKSLFEDDDNESSGSDDDSEDGGAKLADGSAVLKINEEFARRFEHNKKREELQKLEEKHGRALANGKTGDDDSESSDDETEDEEGFLATEDLDAEISATLQAIKNKDPRIYDEGTTFYRSIGEASTAASKPSKEKAVTLKDYHRERYMKGDVGADFEDDSEAAAPPQKTYVQEQEDLKKSIMNEINALAEGGSDDESDDGTFMKKKAKQPKDETPAASGVHPSRASKTQLTEADVATADKDPELFLSNFMTSRAWLPPEGSRWEAFESDDEDKDNVNFAEEFENAYNMRFEDPEKSNEVLKSYSRSLVAEKSVRREEKKGRKRQRELEKERKEAEKQERREERARLRRLKIEEVEEKLKQIKKVAGFGGKKLNEEEWAKLLDDNWDDEKWEAEMRKQFGDDYYAEGEADANSSGDEEASSSKKRKPKKPKWDDDIDIKDIVPDFDDSLPPNITLTDDEGEDDGAEASGDDDDDNGDEGENPAKKRKTSKDHKKDRAAARRAARQERAKIEALVDKQLELDDPNALASPKGRKKQGSGRFRYRETSPTSFGLTAHDILLAPSDAALNEFAGLKKLATFRDAEKKRKDKKHLGKKARLRQWRRDNFGHEFEHTGPTYGFERPAAAAAEDADGGGADHGGRHGKGRDKGKGKDKGKAKEEEEAAAPEEGEKSKKRKRSRGKASA